MLLCSNSTVDDESEGKSSHKAGPFWSVYKMQYGCFNRIWRPGARFVERPGNLTGPKSYFEIEVSRKIGCVLTSNEDHFVPLADNFTAPFSKLLKLQSLMENKTA